MDLLSKLFLRPSRHDLETSKELRRFNCSFGKLDCWVEKSGASSSSENGLFVLRFLGCRGRAEQSTQDPAHFLSHEQSETWTINPPGYGKSDGNADFQTYALACRELCEQLLPHIGNRKLLISGKSIGTLGAVYAATLLKPKLTILKNVVPLGELMYRYRLPTFGISSAMYKLNFPKILDIQSNAIRSQSPALFVISKEDKLSPPAVQLKLMESYAGPRFSLFVEGPHDQQKLSPQDQIRYKEVVRRLYEQNT